MRRLTGDQGLATVTVAITVTVLVGMLAFAIDVGALYAERRELQSGADAAALAIANQCAEGDLACNHLSAPSVAAAYADTNAKDGAHGVDSVDLDLLGQTVSVVTSTVDGSSGGTLLPPFFASVLGFDGATVRAKASAAWGYPRSLPHTLPLIFSDCEWENNYKSHIEAGVEVDALIYFHGDAEPCHDSPSGQDMPGGFGWLDAEVLESGDCAATVEVGIYVSIDPGASPPMECDPGPMSNLVGKVIELPFFGPNEDETMPGIIGFGNTAKYRVAGYGALHVTGYNFGGGFKEGDPVVPCGGADRCIAGYFTKQTVTMGDLGGEDRGIIVVKLTG